MWFMQTLPSTRCLQEEICLSSGVTLLLLYCAGDKTVNDSTRSERLLRRSERLTQMMVQTAKAFRPGSKELTSLRLVK